MCRMESVLTARGGIIGNDSILKGEICYGEMC